MKQQPILILCLFFVLQSNDLISQVKLNYHFGFTGSLMHKETNTKLPPLIIEIEGEPLDKYFLNPLFRPYFGVGVQYEFGKYSFSGATILKTVGSYKNPYDWHRVDGPPNMTISFTFWTVPLELSYNLNPKWSIFGSVAPYWTLMKSRNYYYGYFVSFDGRDLLVDVDHDVNPYRNFNVSASLGVERKISEQFGLRLSLERVLLSPTRQFGGRYDYEPKYTIQALNLGFVYRP
jgi:hypothetical protein